MYKRQSLTRDLTRDAVNFSSKDNLAPTSITLDPTEQFQTMDGFGVAITGATCFNLLQMKPADRHAFLTETFSDDKGFGFSYIRISIGCSDFSLSEYTCCDTKGIENFALQSEEKNYILPILKEILAPVKKEEYGGMQLSLSVGVAFYPKHRTGDKNSIGKYADVALYKAKDSGKDSYCFYCDEMGEF